MVFVFRGYFARTPNNHRRRPKQRPWTRTDQHAAILPYRLAASHGCDAQNFRQFVQAFRRHRLYDRHRRSEMTRILPGLVSKEVYK